MNNNLTLETAQAMIADGWCPMPGRSIIHLDALPDKSDSGLLHIPDSARDRKINLLAGVGTILSINRLPNSQLSGKWDADTLVDWIISQPCNGDRVLISLYDEDRDKSILITRNEVILAVVS